MRIPAFSDAMNALSLAPSVQQRLGGGGELLSGALLDTRLAEIPGGAPLSLCPVSRSTDLFDIKVVEMSEQPLYIDDESVINMYGFMQDADTWTAANSTVHVTVDCGSHCEEYGNPPGERPSDGFSMPFCEVSEVRQGDEGDMEESTCIPKEGRARVSSPVYVMPMFLRAPGWYNFTFDARTAEGERIYCMTAEVCLRWEDEKKNEGYPEGPWTHCSWPR